MNKALCIILILLISSITFGQINNATWLEDNFKIPPTSAQPRTWIHAMSGNISKVGLTKDLEAMADAGIGGIILFNVSHSIPKGKVIFNSPEHIEIIGHAAAECERLGLSFGVHNCDGWTSSGGPWVTPEHSMKQVVYSQTITNGGMVEMKLGTPSERGDYYQDIAVVAYPALEAELLDNENQPKLISSSKNLKVQLLDDGKIDGRTILEASETKPEWIEFQYEKPFTLHSIYINFEKRISAKGKVLLKTSEDGVNFRTIKELKLLRMGKKEHGIDMRIEGIVSKFFRIESSITLDLTEINLSSVKRFDNMLARTSLFKVENIRLPEINTSTSSHAIKKEDMINLTSYMDDDGILTADLPEGQWTIMRFGYTIMGAVNSPASREGTGWEVDKMSRASFKTFYDGYVRNVINVSKPVAPNALQYIEIDSYEVGGQNWTKDYEEYFKAHHDYNIIDYLPLYAGRYMEDTETTERILWDIRNFNSKLMTDNYFDYFTELCHADGLISYVEPYSFNASFNELDAARKVDIPMGEFWMHQRYQAGTAVSGARIYGKNVVSAESFSARPEVNWRGHPGSLKLTGDKAWTLGINEFMFHRYAHQANPNVVPGMTMSQWGSHIDRTQTWWEGAGKAWFKYLSRGQFLLRQGVPFSNLLVFVGDGSPNSIINRHMIKPLLPNHINFDCINTDALVNRITAKGNKMVLPNGIQYQALHLKNVKEIRLSTLKKIAELAENGVVIIGDKPMKLGGFNVTEEDNWEFAKLVNIIWSKTTTYSKGDWDLIFIKQNIPTDLFIENGKDITYTHRKTENEDIYFFFNPDSIHRTYQCTFNVDGKIPELWNQMTGKIEKVASFTHENEQTKVAITLPPEGSTFVIFRESSNGKKSILPGNGIVDGDVIATYLNKDIQLEISKPGKYNLEFKDGSVTTVDVDRIPRALDISSNWQVTFPALKSQEKTFTFKRLLDWSTYDVEEIKYYSGTAIYKKEFALSNEMLSKDQKLVLDLGQVNIAARVNVNGKDFGVSWVTPYKIDISSALVEGKNNILIEVTNQWTNRLIGDENFPNTTDYDIDMDTMPEWYSNNKPANLGQRSTFTTYPFYKKGDELLPAGLVGPVTIFVKKVVIR